MSAHAGKKYLKLVLRFYMWIHHWINKNKKGGRKEIAHRKKEKETKETNKHQQQFAHVLDFPNWKRMLLLLSMLK